MNTNKPSKTDSQYRSFVFFWLPTIFWATLICYLSFTDSGLPGIKFRFIVESDKLAHAGIYFILTLLLARSWVRYFSRRVNSTILVLTGVQVISYSIVMEMLQKLITSTRHYDNMDIVANIVGVILANIAYLLFARFFSKATSTK